MIVPAPIAIHPKMNSPTYPAAATIPGDSKDTKSQSQTRDFF